MSPEHEQNSTPEGRCHEPPELSTHALPLEEIRAWLHESDPARVERLWRQADAVRQQFVGDEVHLRGLVELSSYCGRRCAYCGISSLNRAAERYRMSAAEILDCAWRIQDHGYGTIVMQSGEDHGTAVSEMSEILRQIKAETPLAITLSLGERSTADLAAWREAGADRYLLRFETSDPDLYRLIHPTRDGRESDRIGILKVLKRLGYEVGSGVMVGIPGQTHESLANDIRLFQELDLDMIGVGPFIPHLATPLGSGELVPSIAPGQQVPNTDEMTCKVVALTRLVCPEANLPSTTALGTVNAESGMELGLQRGANVVMPCFTPQPYRGKYAIYPGKGKVPPSDALHAAALEQRLKAVGRTVGRGPGGRKRSQANAPSSGGPTGQVRA